MNTDALLALIAELYGNLSKALMENQQLRQQLAAAEAGRDGSGDGPIPDQPHGPTVA